jgi:hypothetical protein
MEGLIENHCHEVAEFHTHTSVVVVFEAPNREAHHTRVRRYRPPVGIFLITPVGHAGRCEKSQTRLRDGKEKPMRGATLLATEQGSLPRRPDGLNLAPELIAPRMPRSEDQSPG